MNSSKNKYTDVLIIGSGAAGYTASIYAARANLDFYLISGFQPGGQLTITTDIENYPGFENAVGGTWLMNQMKLQAEKSGARIIEDEIVSCEKKDNLFKCVGTFDDEYTAKAIIIATGAQAKWLGLESEKEFRGYGVSACAVCDGSFFKNQIVAVVGGGNVAVEEALLLTKYASKVYLVHRGDKLKAEFVMQSKLMKNEKIEILWNSVLDEVIGEQDPKRVTQMVLRSTIDNSTKKINLGGIFIAIGHTPNTELFKNVVKCDEHGYIITKGKSSQTETVGVFAAGDVCDKVYRQAVVAAGSGCIATIDVQRYLDI